MVPYWFSNHELAKRYEAWGEANVRSTAVDRDRDRRFDKNLWARLGEQGFFRLLVPKEYGGEGVPARDYLAALAGLSRGSLDLPFLLSVAAHGGASVALLNAFGSDAQKRKFLARMGTGECIAALCNSEETAGTDIMGIQSRFEWASDGEGLLHVSKPMVSNLTCAGLMFISAWVPAQKAGGKPRLEVFAVPAGEGVIQRPQTELAGFLTGLTGGVEISGLPMNFEADRVGGAAGGLTVLKFCFALERIMISTIISGSLTAMVDLGLDYVASKQCFGKAIGEFQYIQGKVLKIFSAAAQSDAYIHRLLTDPSLSHRDGFPTDDTFLSGLKLAAVHDGFESARSFFELFGGKGYRDSHLAQKLVRDMLGFKALGGTEEQQRIVIFQNLLNQRERDKTSGELNVQEPNRRAG